MGKLDACVLVSVIAFTVLDTSLLITQNFVPQGPLEGTLNLTISLMSNPTLATALLSSSFTPVALIFLSVTEVLRTLAPWFALFSFLAIVVSYVEKHWH